MRFSCWTLCLKNKTSSSEQWDVIKPTDWQHQPMYLVVTSVQGWNNVVFPASLPSGWALWQRVHLCQLSFPVPVNWFASRAWGFLADWFGHTGWPSSLHSPENFWRAHFGRRQGCVSQISSQYVNLMPELDLYHLHKIMSVMIINICSYLFCSHLPTETAWQTFHLFFVVILCVLLLLIFT